MKNLSFSYDGVQKQQDLFSNYQQKLSQSLKEIKVAINLLETQDKIVEEKDKILEKVVLASQLIAKVTKNLKELEQKDHDKLSQSQRCLTG